MALFNETWGFTPWTSNSVTGAYLNGRCDWTNVTSASDLTLPTCTLGMLVKYLSFTFTFTI